MGFAFKCCRGKFAQQLMTPTGKVLLEGRGFVSSQHPSENDSEGFFVGR